MNLFGLHLHGSVVVSLLRIGSPRAVQEMDGFWPKHAAPCPKYFLCCSHACMGLPDSTFYRQCEAMLSAECTDELNSKKVYRLVSVREMASKYGFSRRKIETIIARNMGFPDEMCPEIAEETRYWCLIEQERTDASAMKLSSSNSVMGVPSS